MIAAVKKIRKELFTTIENEKNVFIIDHKEDFEKYIIRLDYLNDIKSYLKQIELTKCVNEQHRESKAKGIDFSVQIITYYQNQRKIKQNGL